MSTQSNEDRTALADENPSLEQNVKALIGRLDRRLDTLAEATAEGVVELAQHARNGLNRFLSVELRDAPRIHVYPSDAEAADGGEWVLFHEHGGGRLSKQPDRFESTAGHRTQADAIAIGRRAARSIEAVLVVHRSDGTVQSTYHYRVGDTI